MTHIERAGLYKPAPASPKQRAAYQKALKIKTLAYRQGRAKQPLTGSAKLAFDVIEKHRAMGVMTGNVFGEAHQRGLDGLRINGSQPKRKPSKVEESRAAHG